ncbi:MotA/TolQ/ExbB proton channel family protein [Stratiformator vulcanicus]|uniref:Biopolymer transport protein ExbB n=1 Tax=Stratiformator vulcanicus TaxID=2527980 RepID=A0A517R014_9PLAN|nr:MotA/TolQ/ExbB proton channel family protein [Stratiformator vulcanicus]QDT37173.1 Biopolymer transport protein ExbB [Stratiformator vulcanicus]
MRHFLPKGLTIVLIAMAVLIAAAAPALAADPPAEVADGARSLSLTQLLEAGGYIGYGILALSIAMVASIVQHLIRLRKSAFMPSGVAEDVHRCIAAGEYGAAQEICRQRSGLLTHMLSSGLAEVSLGYTAVEKAMEDASTEFAARLFRKIDTLSTIGTIAPMLGLMGTVWGMILAFLEFETKANPQVAELAPGIYRALVTTLLGLGVAVPALTAFAFLRNRIDELVAETSLLAEQVFADFKRTRGRRTKESRKADASREAVGRPLPQPPGSGQSVPSVTLTRERQA